MLVLLFVVLGFTLRGDLFGLTLSNFVFQSFLALRLPRLGKREVILVLFVRLFDLLLLGLSVSSSSWCLGREGLRFVIVALPTGLFSYLFLHTTPVLFVPCGDPRKYLRTFI